MAKMSFGGSVEGEPKAGQRSGGGLAGALAQSQQPRQAPIVQPIPPASKIHGKKFVLTGKMNSVRYDKIQQIENAGGTVIDKGMMHSADYLVIGYNIDPGRPTAKLKAAQQWNVKIIDEPTLNSMF